MKKINVNFFILSVFFLLFAMYAYAIGGNNLKYSSLVIGFILLIFSVNFFKNAYYDARVLFISLFFYIINIYIAYFQDQETNDSTIIIFDFVCTILFVCGYYLGKNLNSIDPVKNYTKNIILIFIPIGFYYLLQFQAVSAIGGNTRVMDDDFLNTNGIAFVSAQIIILLRWLLFIEKKSMYKILLFLSIILVSVNLIFTESRGALLYLLITLGFSYGIKNYIKIKNIIYISLFLYLAFSVINSIDFFVVKINSLYDRLLLGFNFITEQSKSQIDPSLIERREAIDSFLNNFDKMFFGQKNYQLYPHNQFLEIFMRWGVFGLPIFLMSIITMLRCTNIILKKIPKKIPKKSLIFLMCSVFFFTYLQSMTSLSLDNNRFLWLGFGFLIGLSKNNKELISHQSKKNQYV